MSPFDAPDVPEATAVPPTSATSTDAASPASPDPARPAQDPLLRVEDLRVSYATEDGTVPAVDGLV
jgi:hypothetical protein